MTVVNLKMAAAGDEQPNADAPVCAFADFWKAYPRKQAKVEAEKAWRQIGGEQFPYMLGAIEKSKKRDDWRRNNGQFIPLPASYLRGKRFDDELETDLTMGQCSWNINGNRDGEVRCVAPGTTEKRNMPYCTKHAARIS